MRLVLVFQCGIANVFKVDRFSAIPQRRGNVVRLYQGDFRSAEMMATGAGYAGGTRPDGPLRTGGRRGGRDLERRPRRHVPAEPGTVRLTGPRRPAPGNPRAIAGFAVARAPGGPAGGPRARSWATAGPGPGGAPGGRRSPRAGSPRRTRTGRPAPRSWAEPQSDGGAPGDRPALGRGNRGRRWCRQSSNRKPAAELGGPRAGPAPAFPGCGFSSSVLTTGRNRE